MHAILFALAAASPPLSGPYQTTHSTMKMPDPHYQHPIDVYYPLNTADNFRFVSFAHGAGGGSVILPVVYKSLLHSLASWGYVVAATKACMMGSNDTCHYYEHQLRVIDWARGKAADGTAPFALANFSTVAIVGHSMGGEATMLNSQASSAALLRAFAYFSSSSSSSYYTVVPSSGLACSANCDARNLHAASAHMSH